MLRFEKGGRVEVNPQLFETCVQVVEAGRCRASLGCFMLDPGYAWDNPGLPIVKPLITRLTYSDPKAILKIIGYES